MSRSGERRKKEKGLGVLGLVTAAMFGVWLDKSMPSHAAPTVTARAAAVEPVAAGAGFPTVAVIVAGVVALAAGLVVWFVVGKVRDVLEDRRAAEANRVDQVAQMQARQQAEALTPRVWRYTLTGQTSNGATGKVSDEITFPSSSREVVRREVLRRAYAKDPQAKLTATVEPVSR